MHASDIPRITTTQPEWTKPRKSNYLLTETLTLLVACGVWAAFFYVLGKVLDK